MNFDACLPAELRGPATTITRISAGLSGAGVYRIETTGGIFVLKIADEGEPLTDWRRKVEIQQLAANAALAPRIVHIEATQRAVLSAFVADRSFPALFFNPATREAALVKLGQTLRRVHQLPLPPGSSASDPRQALATIWSKLEAGFALPDFVGNMIRETLAEEPPMNDRLCVMSHNDVNPSNLVYDGTDLLLLDWEVAGPNDPFYDLAAIAVFLRMDDATCLQLLAAYDNHPVSRLPARFVYDQRFVAVLCGATILNLARQSGHAGATSGVTLASTLSLGEFYQRMRAGSLSPATAEGQWCFGLALIKAAAVP